MICLMLMRMRMASPVKAVSEVPHTAMLACQLCALAISSLGAPLLGYEPYIYTLQSFY